MGNFDQRGQKVKRQTNISDNQYNAGRDINHVEGDAVIARGNVSAGNRNVSADVGHTHGIMLVVSIGVIIAGMAMAGIGAYLVYLGSTGSSEFQFFGQQFKSSNIGVAAIFIGAAMIVLVLRRLLKSVDLATSSGAKRK